MSSKVSPCFFHQCLKKDGCRAARQDPHVAAFEVLDFRDARLLCRDPRNAVVLLEIGKRDDGNALGPGSQDRSRICNAELFFPRADRHRCKGRTPARENIDIQPGLSEIVLGFGNVDRNVCRERRVRQSHRHFLGG
jgi:hypothetical protein